MLFKTLTSRYYTPSFSYKQEEQGLNIRTRTSKIFHHDVVQGAKKYHLANSTKTFQPFNLVILLLRTYSKKIEGSI